MAREQVIKNVRTTNPGDVDTWKAQVEKPALALHPKMERLSSGYGGGLLATIVIFFAVSGFFLTVAINKEHCDGVDALNDLSPGSTRNRYLVAATIPPILVLLFAIDFATTSSQCDLLMDELNAARIEYGPEHYIRVTWLTTSLEKLVSA